MQPLIRMLGVAVMVTFAGAAAAASLPANVRVVSNDQSGVPSPDGTRFLYQVNGALVVANVTTGRPILRIAVPTGTCPHSTCSGFGFQTFVWSPTGKEIAFSFSTEASNRGIYVVDVTARRPRPRRVADAPSWQLAYDAANTLVYVTGVSRFGEGGAIEIWRAGERAAFLSIPARGDGQVHALHRSLVISTVQRRDRSSQLVAAEVWLTDLASGAATRLAVPAHTSVSVSPAEDRACFEAADQLQCIVLATQVVTPVIGHPRCGRGDGSGRPWLPWSPSGRRIATFACRGDHRVIVVHDFETATTRDVADDDAFGRIEFQTEDLLLLLYGTMPVHYGRDHAALVRIDIRTGDRFALVADITSYPHASPIPGRADFLYAARDNESATHLAWIDTRKPIGPAPRARTPPRDGVEKRWHENGRKRLEARHVNGRLDGVLRRWDWDGTLMEQGSYAAGAKHGTWSTWFPDGKLEQRATFAAGQRDGVEVAYWRRGGKQSKEIHWRAGLQHGTFRSWYETGAQAISGVMRDGKRDGTWLTWSETGKRSREERWRAGLQHGTQRTWDHNGRLAMEGEAVDGKRQGAWRMLGTGGERIVHYVDGKEVR